MIALKKGIIKKSFLALAALAIAYVIYVVISISLYGGVDETTKADVAIVLGAGVWGDEPSPVFKERINHGIWLYENGYVNKIIFTGGKGKGNEYSDSFIARKYAMENGIPLEDIFIEEQSTITQENIFYAAQILRHEGMLSALIVSDPLHMKRSMMMAKDNGLTAFSCPTPTTGYKTLKTQLPFLARETFFYLGYQIVGRFQYPTPQELIP